MRDQTCKGQNITEALEGPRHQIRRAAARGGGGGGGGGSGDGGGGGGGGVVNLVIAIAYVDVAFSFFLERILRRICENSFLSFRCVGISTHSRFRLQLISGI